MNSIHLLFYRLPPDHEEILAKLARDSPPSPLGNSESLRPKIVPIGRPESKSRQSRPSVADSIISTIDAEENLALRTCKDIDGLGRRLSTDRKKKPRKGLWNKFVSWSSKRNFVRAACPGRPVRRSSSCKRNSNVDRAAPRRMQSDPGKSRIIKQSSTAPDTDNMNATGSPTIQCMIHIFTTSRIFFGKCDVCHRRMALSCKICSLCK